MRATLQSPAVRLSRTRASENTDRATQQTVEKMCELIQDSARDPQVQACARYAQKHFGMGSNDPAAIAWGVFWYVKHCVRFRLDEHTMFQVGEKPEQDLLIAPAVLVRMQNPSEDCDGFTMLTAALLTVLNVPVLICTVATEPQDPSRWSHVFLCAVVNGRMLPLDTSHGPCPGWMVPRHRIYRFQAWTIDGRPANVSIPSYQGLHGYGRGLGARGAQRAALRLLPRRRGVRGFGLFRGLGQDDSTDDSGDEYTSENDTEVTSEFSPTISSSDVDSITATAQQTGFCVDPSTGGFISCPSGTPAGSVVSAAVSGSSDLIGCTPGYYLSGTSCIPNPNASSVTNPNTGQVCTLSGTSSSGTYNCPGGGTAPTSATPNWGALAQQAINTAGADAKIALQQPAALLNAQTWANLSAYLPIFGIAVVGLVIFTSLVGGKK